MNEMQIFYWIGYFTATGIILCVGIIAWFAVLNIVNIAVNKTLNACNAVYMVALATKYLKSGKIKDANGGWWDIKVIDGKKIILELKED